MAADNGLKGGYAGPLTATPQAPGLGDQPAGDAQTQALLVEWDAVTSAEGYLVQCKSGEQRYHDTRRRHEAGSDATSYTILGLTPGTDHLVQVTATRSGGSNGRPSASVVGTPLASEPPAQSADDTGKAFTSLSNGRTYIVPVSVFNVGAR